jgi:integrase
MSLAIRLEERHKDGEIDLWNTKIKIIGGKVVVQGLRDSKQLTINDGIKLWKNYAEKTLQPSTIENREFFFNAFSEEFNNADIETISLEDINEIVNDSASLDTRNSRKTYFNHFFKALRAEGYKYMFNITVLSTLAEQKKGESVASYEWITVDELENICQAHIQICENEPVRTQGKKKFVHFFRMSFYIGLRITEALKLDRSWINNDFTILSIESQNGSHTAKSQKKVERAPLIPEAQDLLRKIIDDLPSTNRHHLSKSFKAAAAKVLDKRKIDHIHYHSLRHSFVMYCLDELHYSERDVKQLARIKDDRTFARYKHDNIEGLVEKINSGIKNKKRIKKE